MRPLSRLLPSRLTTRQTHLRIAVFNRIHRAMSTPSKYDTWSREDLIAKLISLETDVSTAAAEPATTAIDTDVPDPPLSRKRRAGKEPRPFDMSRYSRRHVAFKLAYLGWNYSGFAAQGNESKVPTVEGRIFEALMSAKLIEDPLQCSFSRCGRTDKGVSGLGQVIALDVRSNLPKEPEDREANEGEEVALSNAMQDVESQHVSVSASSSSTTITEPAKKSKSLTELPYIEILNRLLPDDIRIIAWAPVPSTFDARFDCRWRTYRYFFPRGTLDISLMRQAAAYFLGSHNFRNFCKLDPSKNITNYERTIAQLDIHPVSGPDCSALGPGMDIYELKLRGTAFLWHQVRCMMAVLFLVGQRLESPEIVRELLDVSRYPARPGYVMASELPLVLYDCEFESVAWRYSQQEDAAMSGGRGRTGAEATTSIKLYRQVLERWCEHMIKSLVCSAFLGTLGGVPVPMGDGKIMTLDECRREGMGDAKAPAADVVLGGGKEVRMSKYTRLADMQMCDSDEVKKEKYKAKKARIEK
ncbi:pseudouridine synthase [Endogone sp. FLAS-F59071]|nr:pseudouridine synthase [Endogone sp. FLAS-F59071]|eukprot:RUS20895.1 pseudouridine synthase [Endogone sp. FLAS-F59071]